MGGPGRLAPRPLAAIAAGLVGSALLLAGCAPAAAGARAALEQFLRDVHSHQSAYAYGYLSPQAASATPFTTFHRAVLASSADFTVVSVHAHGQSRAEAVVVATGIEGTTRRFPVTMVEIGTAGDWMLAAPFTSRGSSATTLARRAG